LRRRPLSVKRWARMPCTTARACIRSTRPCAVRWDSAPAGPHGDRAQPLLPSCGRSHNSEDITMEQSERKRRKVQRLAEAAVPQPERRPGSGRGHKRPTPTKHGNSTRYLVARIARDRPDILARMQAGEFESVLEAARLAGIRRSPSLVDIVKRLWAKANPDE